MIHTLEHALRPEASGCSCNVSSITHCVICEKRLPLNRDQVDTCAGWCYKRLLHLQRGKT